MIQAEPRFVAVLGDVVRSRRHPDRAILQRSVAEAMDLANAKHDTIQALTATIGDEFQGLYDGVAAALDATLRVRLALLHRVDVRFGIGWGSLTAHDPDRAPFEQDGPAWWAARDAIDLARGMAQHRERPRGVRTRFIAADPEAAPLAAAIDAFLLCRDEIVASMSRRDAATALGLLDGEALSAIADEQGITSSAVSQRAIRSGLYALRMAHEALRDGLR
jgi:hypothetical protein